MCTREMFTNINNRVRSKVAYFLRKMQTSRVNDWTILRIKNEIFRVLFLHGPEYIGRFSKLHQCTFNCNDLQKLSQVGFQQLVFQKNGISLKLLAISTNLISGQISATCQKQVNKHLFLKLKKLILAIFSCSCGMAWLSFHVPEAWPGICY